MAQPKYAAPGKPRPEKPTTVYPGREPVGGGFVTGYGLIARFSKIKNVTPDKVLKSKLYLPCVLNTLTVQETALWNDYNTVSNGQFSQPGAGGRQAQQLKTLNIDTLTLAWSAKWLVVTHQNEITVRKTLAAILRARAPVQLMINFHPHPSKTPEFNSYVRLNTSSTDIRPGEGDTRYITFEIEEWRDPTTGRRSSTTGDGARARGVKLPTSVKLAAGDTLDSLSYAYYGTYSNWRFIRDANGISHKFGAKTPVVNLKGRWKVGTKIKIPQVGKLPAASTSKWQGKISG